MTFVNFVASNHNGSLIFIVSFHFMSILGVRFIHNVGTYVGYFILIL